MVRLVMDQLLSPNRGAWLELETDSKDIAYTRIDRTRKIPFTTLVRALGFSGDDEIIDIFRGQRIGSQYHRKRYPQKPNGFTDR